MRIIQTHNWHREEHWVEFHDDLEIAAVKTYQWYNPGSLLHNTLPTADKLEIKGWVRKRNGQEIRASLLKKDEFKMFVLRVAWIRKDCARNRIPVEWGDE